MRKGIATQTNRFELYDLDTGNRFRGTVTVQLPALETATNTFSGAGVGGEINSPAPGMMTAQTVTISVPLIYGEITAFFELGSARKIDLRRDIIVHDTETGGILHVPDRWLVQGPVTKSDPGKAEQKAAGDASIEMQAYYIMHWLDGEEILEWHAFNTIHTVNKKDLLAETRRNLLL